MAESDGSSEDKNFFGGRHLSEFCLQNDSRSGERGRTGELNGINFSARDLISR